MDNKIIFAGIKYNTMIGEDVNPWKKVSTQNIYDNPWINVREDKVINPAGNDGIYGVVTFKNKAIGIVPLDEEGYIYLVGQYRYPVEEYSWEIPEGGGRLDIDPLESAKRELREETGFTATNWKLIGRIHTSNSVCNEEGLLYLAEGLQEGHTEHEETEVIEVKKVLLKEAVDMVMDMKITDSLSMAAILIAARIKGI